MVDNKQQHTGKGRGVTATPFFTDTNLLAERIAPGSGILCNDANGLCLGYRGTIDASQSGTYTTLTKLASLLEGSMDGTAHNSGGDNGAKGSEGEGQSAAAAAAPIVSIQTDKATILLKEYGGGRTVAVRVPNIVVVAEKNGTSSVLGETQEGEPSKYDDNQADENMGECEVGSGDAENNPSR
jgi:hypothetical protein